MSPEVRSKCQEYFKSIGGIESVKKKYRYKLIRSVLQLYLELETYGLISRCRILFMPPKKHWFK